MASIPFKNIDLSPFFGTSFTNFTTDRSAFAQIYNDAIRFRISYKITDQADIPSPTGALSLTNFFDEYQIRHFNRGPAIAVQSWLPSLLHFFPIGRVITDGFNISFFVFGAHLSHVVPSPNVPSTNVYNYEIINQPAGSAVEFDYSYHFNQDIIPDYIPSFSNEDSIGEYIHPIPHQ